MKHFNEANIPQVLLQRLEQIGFLMPTPIQMKVIPHALGGRDILGSAQTGTGKTAAYGIPLVTRLLEHAHGSALVLLPTRELAMQVMRALQQMIGQNRISTALLIGGEDMGRQLRKLRTCPRLIVGTPGRINDHLSRGTLKLKNTKFLVLDEVDRMLGMGFCVQLEAIANYLTAERQTLMFSATVPKDIQKISAKYLNDYIRISLGASHEPVPKVKQSHLKLSGSEKYPRLLDELQNRSGSIIVFVKTKRSADSMKKKLREQGHKVDAFHSDLRQNRRTHVITNFHNQNNCRILVATDLAARGLDIPHVEHIINYDLPQNPEDYIHRIGRTARAGAEGEALDFITPADYIKWSAIQRFLNPDMKQERLSSPKKGSYKSYKKHGKRKFQEYRKRRRKETA